MKRRSLARPHEGPPAGEDADTTQEIRMRRSLARASLNPTSISENVLRRLSSVGSGSSPGSGVTTCNPTMFFNCLKLAAENKINTKNAFSLAMIDYLSVAVKSHESPLDNFQLAGCSLDAGTKIYAARVDHVAGNVAEFAMSLSMMKKKGSGGEGDGNGDEYEEDGQQKKPKKFKRKNKSRVSVLANDPSELTLDMSKTIPKNKMFSIVGNLMDISLDSFTFTERNRNGAVPEMRRQVLEESAEDSKVLVNLPQSVLTVASVCPSLTDFTFRRPSMDTVGRSHRKSRRTLSPRKSMRGRLTLTCENFEHDDVEAFDDEPAGTFDDNTFEGGTIIEEIAACGALGGGRDRVGDARDLDDTAFTAQTPGPHQSMYFLGDKENLPRLYGPDYWKFKRPTKVGPTLTATKSRKVVEDGPIDFTRLVDLSRLKTSQAKTYLSRDTMLRWSVDKLLLPSETYAESLLTEDPKVSLFEVGLVDSLKIPFPGAVQQQEHHEDKTPGRVPYNFDNEVDKQDYCPFPEEPILPSDDENDSDNYETGAEDLFQDGEVFNNLFNLSADTQVMKDDNIFRESMLVPIPVNMVSTVAPVWKASRSINMRHLEALMWKEINEQDAEESQGGSEVWKFTKLRGHLPEKTRTHTSVTSTMYALLNLANKKGLEITTNKNLTDLKVKCIRSKKDRSVRKSRTHPALLGL